MTYAAQVVLGLVSVLAGPVDDGRVAAAPAPEQPLLVIVERVHGATASPEQVRRAISEELKRPVIGPTEAAGKSASQMLVVTIAPDSIAMQVRSVGDAAPRRRIESVASGESGLRVVAWLAGNLARDQAGELMDALPSATVAAAEAKPVAPPPAPVAPSPLPPPEPAAATAAVATKAFEEPPTSDGAAPWRFEVSLGQLVGTLEKNWYLNLPRTEFYRVEVVAPSRPGKWSWTAGLDLTNDGPQSQTYFISSGLARRFVLVPRWLAADTGWGLGLVLSRFPTQQPIGGGMYLYTNETIGPNLLAQVSGTLAFVRLRFGEIVAGARIADSPEAVKEPWFAFSAGLRVALQ